MGSRVGVKGWGQGVGSRVGVMVRVSREQRSTVAREHVRLLAAVGVVLVLGAS